MPDELHKARQAARQYGERRRSSQCRRAKQRSRSAMKRLWDSLLDPYIGIILLMVFINMAAQLADLFSDASFNYMMLSGFITVGYIAGVIMTFCYGPPGK
jgi:hypothetical protein